MTGTPLPDLPEDQVALLATLGPEGPTVIPVSALHRVDERTLLFALKADRAGRARLRDDDRAALSLSGAGFSVSARGRATIAADPLPGAEAMVAFRFRVERSWDARGPATEIVEGIRWRWTAAASADHHRAVLEALAALAPDSMPGS
ncbi:MAG: pyridoxamine 5'-phosphate oxidase family protein [Miltoncostaeaceae bacterium]